MSSLSFHWKTFSVVLLCIAGCVDTNAPTIGSKDESQPTVSEPQPAIEEHLPSSTGNAIVSDGPITIENGKVTFGRPEVTEEVERNIYKSLSYFRNLANAIEKKVPGGNAGSRQSRQDYSVAATAFKLQHSLSDADLDAILKKGDEQGWK